MTRIGRLRPLPLMRATSVGPLRIFREHLVRNAFLVEHLLQILDRANFVARRTARIESAAAPGSGREFRPRRPRRRCQTARPPTPTSWRPARPLASLVKRVEPHRAYQRRIQDSVQRPVLALLTSALSEGFMSDDAIDLHAAVIHNSPSDIASWPATTLIERLTMRPGQNNGLSFTFGGNQTWPDYVPPGWTGPNSVHRVGGCPDSRRVARGRFHPNVAHATIDWCADPRAVG